VPTRELSSDLARATTISMTSLKASEKTSLIRASVAAGRVEAFRYCAVQPPSMTSSLPVMNADSSEARYRTP
jgi:hypothetical protein